MDFLKNPIIFLSLAILVVTTFVFSFLSPHGKRQLPLPLTPPTVTLNPPTKTPTPQPIIPIASGKQIYNVSRGSGSSGPAITQVTLDPLDPKIGETQVVSVKIEHKVPVQSVSVTIRGDTSQFPYNLTLKEGTPTSAVWEGSWVVDYTYDYDYQAVVEAKDATEATQVTLTFR